MKIGVVGLGKMGANIALNLLDQGVEVVGYDIDNNSRMLASKQGISVVSSIQSLVSELPKRKVIWLMIRMSRFKFPLNYEIKYEKKKLERFVLSL